MRTLTALTLLSLFLAPLPYGIALNHQTKECGSFQGGDEWATYWVPPEWKIYYPNDGVYRTEIGNCDVKDGIESCCQQLGYKYVPGNIAVQYGVGVLTPLGIIFLCFQWWPLIPPLVVIGILVFLYRQKPTTQT